MAVLPRPVTMMMFWMPEWRASSTPYWMRGLSTSGSISLGCALVAGRNRVPSPAAGKTALRTFGIIRTIVRGDSELAEKIGGGELERIAGKHEGGNVLQAEPGVDGKSFRHGVDDPDVGDAPRTVFFEFLHQAGMTIVVGENLDGGQRGPVGDAAFRGLRENGKVGDAIHIGSALQA